MHEPLGFQFEFESVLAKYSHEISELAVQLATLDKMHEQQTLEVTKLMTATQRAQSVRQRFICEELGTITQTASAPSHALTKTWEEQLAANHLLDRINKQRTILTADLKRLIRYAEGLARHRANALSQYLSTASIPNSSEAQAEQ